MNVRLPISIILLAIILIVSAAIFFAYIGGEYYFIAADHPLYNLTITAIYNEFFIWNALDYSGALQGILSPISTLLLLANLFFIKIFGVGFGNALYEYLFYAIGGIGMFSFLYELTKDYGKLPAYLGSFIGAGLFVFEIQSYLGTNEISAMFLPILFLFLFYLVERTNKPKYIFGSVIALAIIISLAGELSGADILLYIVFCIAFLLISKAGKYRKKLFATFILILSLAILTTIAIPLSIFYYINVYNVNVNNVLSYNYKIFSSNIIGTQLSYFMPTYNINIGNNLLLAVLGICFLILIILNIEQLMNKDYRLKHQLNYGFLFGLFVSFIFFIFLVTASNKPFGPIFSTIFMYIPQIRIFTVLHSYTIFLFLFSSLIGLSIAYLTKKFITNKIILPSFLIAISILFVLYLYFFAYMPIYGNLGFPLKPVGIKSIPEHVALISNYVNNKYGNFAVGTLPISADGAWQLDSWYFGENIYSSFVTKHPTYTGGFSFYNNQFYFPISTKLYNLLGSQFDTNITMYKFSKVFGVLGIKYVIIQGDTLKNATIFSKKSPRFNISTIYYNLNNSGMTFVKKISNSSIYENNYYLPLTYISNIENLGNASINTIFENMGNISFNMSNISFYSTHIDNFYNDGNTINATPIANFSRPNLSFVDNNPTLVTVHVSNATTPYYLVFRETYDPHWVAFYSNGTEVNPHDHIAVNGFANAWYMNKTGNYTITLYYTLQTDAWIAWGVSFVALFVTIGIGVYGWKETKKEKMHSRR